MTHEASRSPVVFLGPSLPLVEARRILGAEYLPPARFGDVYRLIGSGVHTIVLIDGVFHGHAPVWQRELLCAIENGIRVYGAGSMGALRAAELRPHGMIGLGGVYRSYSTGEIDGDDEVALLHAGPEQSYRPLSEPLVNIRFNLQRAVADGILEQELADSLLGAMKVLPFWDRSMDALWEAATSRGLHEHRRDGLRQYLVTRWVDLKRQDAAQALAAAARHEPEGVASASPLPLPATAYHDRFRLLRRNFGAGRPPRLDGEAIVGRILADPERRKLIQGSLSAQFFVEQWARERGVRVPPGEDVVLEQAWHGSVVSGPLTTWMHDSSITEKELREQRSRQMLWLWLLDQPPARFGLAPILRDASALPELSALDPCSPAFERASLAHSLPYVAAWCRMVGAAPGPKATLALVERWGPSLPAASDPGDDDRRDALLHALWAIERGPTYFGFTTWSLSTELLCKLQITGVAARLSAQGSEPAA